MDTADNQKVVLVSGGSSGLGRACVNHLSELGHRVYGTSRGAEFPSHEDALRFPMLLPMDVRDSHSIEAALSFILQREGRLDVLVNNAGIALAGSIEETSSEEAQAQFDTNFFGVHRVCRSVLPIMRKQASGLIINIGSMGGVITLPFQGFYCASKQALEALTDALRMEVGALDIQVTLLEPGDFRTELTKHRLFARGSRPTSVYATRQAAAVAVMEKNERNGPDPRQLAVVLAGILTRKRVRRRYLVGMFYQKMAVWAKRSLPGCLFEKLIMAYYRI